MPVSVLALPKRNECLTHNTKCEQLQLQLLIFRPETWTAPLKVFLTDLSVSNNYWKSLKVSRTINSGIKQGAEPSLCVKFPAIAVTECTGSVLHISFVFHSIL